MSRLRAVAAIPIARLAAVLGRLIGKQGTSLPGRVLLAIDPRANARMAASIPNGTVVISATNGKTTTAAMVAEILAASGLHPVHNNAGANMAGGIASALLSDPLRDSRDSIGLFEVDEFWLPGLAGDLHPRAVLLGNLFRDQLDRYGELDTIVDRWRTAVAALARSGTKLVLCADDPGVASLADGIPADSLVWFGIDDADHALSEIPHSADSDKCRRCGSDLDYDTVLLGHLGHWRCPACQSVRPRPAFRVEKLSLRGAHGSRMVIDCPEGPLEVTIALPGVYNAYNAAGAVALALTLGVPRPRIREGLERTRPAFGRAETFELLARDTTLMLIKNPTGANEVIRTLALEQDPLDMVVILNDRIADGRDVSWIWDADFELLAERISSIICSGTRSAELALRMKYAGVPSDLISTETDPLSATERSARNGTGRLWVLPTYTALLELRSGLVERGVVEAIR